MADEPRGYTPGPRVSPHTHESITYHASSRDVTLGYIDVASRGGGSEGQKKGLDQPGKKGVTRTGPHRVNSIHATPVGPIVQRLDAHLTGVSSKIWDTRISRRERARNKYPKGDARFLLFFSFFSGINKRLRVFRSFVFIMTPVTKRNVSYSFMPKVCDFSLLRRRRNKFFKLKSKHSECPKET